MEAEKGANPGYRAFFADGVNVTQALALFFWEVLLEWTAAARAKRRDVQPRGHRGGGYLFLRGALCVIVRTRSCTAYHGHDGAGRRSTRPSRATTRWPTTRARAADTLEALRKLDQQFGRIERARQYAPRPYEIVVLSDHGQTQGATFKQRNGYGLDELVERSLTDATVAAYSGGDEQQAMVGHAVNEATGQKPRGSRTRTTCPAARRWCSDWGTSA